MKNPRKLVLVALGVAGSVALGIGVAGASAPVAANGPGHATANAPVKPAVTIQSNPEAVYTPVKNCRLVNTAVAGGVIPGGGTRSFYISGTGGFTGQGGTSGGCGIPFSATAISARVTATSATANGAFVAYPTGTPVGQGTLYYAKGVNVTTGATLQLGPGTGQRLTVKDVSGPAQLIIDVNGYYSPQIQAVLNYNGGIYAGTTRVLSSTNTGTGTYQVAVDRDLTGCTPIASVYGGPYFATAVVSGSTVYATTYSASGTPTNLYWSLVVDC